MAFHNSSFSSFINATAAETCTQDFRSMIILAVWFTNKNLLVLPPYALVLFVGVRRWRQQRHAVKNTSNADVLTYNMAVLQIVGVAGGVLFFWGVFENRQVALKVGFYTFSIILPGETLIHSLTCVDLYLAVVRPFLYLKSRQKAGVRIRNVCIALAWATAFSVAPIGHFPATPSTESLILLGINLAVVSFCEVSVLSALLRPGPSDNGKIDKAKRKAFHNILAIFVMSLLWFAGFMTCLLIKERHIVDFEASCLIYVVGFWFNIPSSLVLPVMFLQRGRKHISC